MPNKKVIGIGCLILTMICCLLTCIFSLVNPMYISLFFQAPPLSPAWHMKNTADDFMQKIQANQQEQAFELLTSDYQNTLGEPDSLSGIFHAPVSNVTMPYARLNDTDPNKGTVIGAYVDGKNKKMALMLSFEKDEQGNWKISHIKNDPIKNP